MDTGLFTKRHYSSAGWIDLLTVAVPESAPSSEASPARPSQRPASVELSPSAILPTDPPGPSTPPAPPPNVNEAWCTTVLLRYLALVVIVAAVVACSVAPNVPPSPEWSPDPHATPAGTPAPRPTPSEPPASTPPATSIQFDLSLISTRNYREPSLVVDTHGYAHIAATWRHDIHHLTNRDGSWTREQVTNAPAGDQWCGKGHDGESSIALDESGSLWISFTRWDAYTYGCAPSLPSGIFFVTNESGSWSEAVELVGEQSWNRQLSVGDGAVHVGYDDWFAEGSVDLGDLDRPLYGALVAGTWHTLPLAERGSVLAMHISEDDIAHFLLTTWAAGEADLQSLYYATVHPTNRSISTERVPLPAGDYQVIGAFDPAGQPHVLWRTSHYDAAADAYVTSETSYLRMTGSWQEELALPYFPSSVVIDEDGAFHAIAIEELEDERTEVWYSTNRDGDARSTQLGCCADRSSIALDAEGRIHAVFGSSDELWYALGPDL